MKLHVSEIREGDQFTGDAPDDVSPHVFWTALADTEEDGNGGFDLHVRFPDGGSAWRHWDEDIELTFIPGPAIRITPDERYRNLRESNVPHEIASKLAYPEEER